MEKSFRKGEIDRILLPLFILLLLSSCLFIKGTPFYEETMEVELATWKLKIDQIFPAPNSAVVSTDNDLVIHLNNSLDTQFLGQVSFGSPAVTYVDNSNCEIRFITVNYPNDTIVIDPYDDWLASYSYYGLTVEGFKDFKGNRMEPLFDSSYYFFTAVGTPPELLSINPIPATLGFPASNNLVLIFNETIDTGSAGRLKLTSNARTLELRAGVNCSFYFAGTNSVNDTVIIDPYFDFPGNLYYELSIEGFSDIKGSTMLAYLDNSYGVEFAGLVASYPFSNSRDDSGGNYYHPTYVDGTTLASDRFANNSSAAAFDGSTDFIDYPSMDFTGSFTISFWIMPQLGGMMPILSKGTTLFDGEEWQTEFALLHTGNNQIRFLIGSADSGFYTDVSSTSRTTPNKWYHIAAVCRQNGGDHTLSLYVDGSLSGVRTESYPRKLSPSGAPLEVGRYYMGWPQFFMGRIDDIRIYNYALSSNQISSLYAP